MKNTCGVGGSAEQPAQRLHGVPSPAASDQAELHGSSLSGRTAGGGEQAQHGRARNRSTIASWSSTAASGITQVDKASG